MEKSVPPKALRRYAVTYLSIVVVFSLLAGIGTQIIFALFLWRAGEFMPLRDIVERQLKSGAIYGSAIHEDGFAYKLELAAAMAPEIIALGSSRILQFRQDVFDTTFVNAGRAMIVPAEGQKFMAALAPRHKPKIIIIGLDFWWFNPNRSDPHRRARNASLDLAALRLAESWFWQGKVSPSDLWRVAVLGDLRNPLSERDNIGVAAIKRGNGYRADGSRDYGLRYAGRDPTFDDQGFANTLGRVKRAEAQFVYGQSTDGKVFGEIKEFLRYLEHVEITPIIVLPPLSRRVLDAMQRRGADYGYFAEMRKFASGLKIEAYDFTEPESLGAGDCEFVDGFHGGEVVYMRMLAEILKRNPASALAPYLNAADLVRTIQQAGGHVLSQQSARQYALAESDFLQLGCLK